MAGNRDEASPGRGRRPPPRNRRFEKGRSGNPAGRPRGAVSTKKMTAKFASHRLSLKVQGRIERKSRLEIAILKLIGLAAEEIELLTAAPFVFRSQDVRNR